MAKRDSSKQIQAANNEKTDVKPSRQVIVNAQYIKDFSFENPGAPASLVGNRETPKISISVDVQVQKIAEENFEVTLAITANANIDDKKLFLVELSYAGIFSVKAPEQELGPVLMVYCPNLLFPYARRVISDTVRDGGFPPLLLDPIDFASIYQQHQKANAQKQKANA